MSYNYQDNQHQHIKYIQKQLKMSFKKLSKRQGTKPNKNQYKTRQQADQHDRILRLSNNHNNNQNSYKPTAGH